jgi:hypothetical protein
MASGWREPTGKRFYRAVDTGPLAKLEVFHLPLPKLFDSNERRNSAKAQGIQRTYVHEASRGFL